MKRISRFLLAPAFALLLITAFSAATVTLASDAMITVTPAGNLYEPGDTFTVNIDITNNPGFAVMALKVSYPAGLEVIDVQPGATALINGLTLWNGWEPDESPPVPIADHFFALWVRTSNFTPANATLLAVTFRVTPKAVTGENPITATFESAQGARTPINLDEQPLTIGIANGTVTVNNFGDVPPTGLPDRTYVAAAMLALIAVSAVLWGYLLRRKLRKAK